MSRTQKWLWAMSAALLLAGAGTLSYAYLRASAVGLALAAGGGSDAIAEEWRLARNDRAMRRMLAEQAADNRRMADREERLYQRLREVSLVLSALGVLLGITAWRARQRDRVRRQQAAPEDLTTRE